VDRFVDVDQRPKVAGGGGDHQVGIDRVDGLP
jgi:hypothetical protein